MPISVEWANEQKTAFCWTFEGKWTWNEYTDAMRHSNTLASEVSHPIDVIVDVQRSSIVPTNVLSYMRFERADQPEKMGRIVVVGASQLVKTLIQVLSRLNRNFEVRFQVVKSMDEARQVVKVPFTPLH